MILRDENGFIKSIVLTGRPGIGKSHVLRKIFDDHEIVPEHVVVFSLAEMSDPDSIGCYPIPFTDNGPDNFRIINVIQQDQLTPLLERNIGERYGVLILDDVTGAPPQVQNTLLNLVQFRNIGGNKLGKNVFIGLTGNNVDDDANATSWNQALVDRCMFVEFEPDLESWIELNCNKDIDPSIVYFLRERPQFFAPRGAGDEIFTTDRNNKAPSPRSWTSLGNAITQINGARNFKPTKIFKSFFQFVSSYVGEQTATNYLLINEFFEKFPSSERIFADPEIWLNVDQKEREKSLIKISFVFGLRATYQRMISMEHDEPDQIAKKFFDALFVIGERDQEVISYGISGMISFFKQNPNTKAFRSFLKYFKSLKDPTFKHLIRVLEHK